MKSLSWPSWPQFGKEESDVVLRVISRGQLFAADEVHKFEQQFASYCNIDCAIAIGNATQGLHLALAALGIGIGDEVIVTSYSWISSASCILMQNATPIFADCSKERLSPEPIDIECLITPRTKAILLTHVWGHSFNIPGILAICQRYNIPLIEDAAHAHGALLIDSGQKLGTFGTIGVFSFHQRKNLPVGDGGICVTRSFSLADKIRRLRSFGHHELSYNYRMTEFAGALGQVGLSKLEKQNKERRDIFAYLCKELKQFESNIRVYQGDPNCLPSHHKVVFLIQEESEWEPNELVRTANLAGIPLEKTWKPLHQHPHFNPEHIPARGIPWAPINGSEEGARQYWYSLIKLPKVEKLCNRTILQIDLHPGTTKEHIDQLKQLFLSFDAQ